MITKYWYFVNPQGNNYTNIYFVAILPQMAQYCDFLLSVFTQSFKSNVCTAILTFPTNRIG